MGTYMIYIDIAEVSMFDCQVTMTTKFLFKVNFDVLTGKYIYIYVYTISGKSMGSCFCSLRGWPS